MQKLKKQECRSPTTQIEVKWDVRSIAAEVQKCYTRNRVVFNKLAFSTENMGKKFMLCSYDHSVSPSIYVCQMESPPPIDVFWGFFQHSRADWELWASVSPCIGFRYRSGLVESGPYSLTAAFYYSTLEMCFVFLDKYLPHSSPVYKPV